MVRIFISTTERWIPTSNASERNSRKLTRNSTTSKPSTESDTAIKKSRWFRLGRPMVETPDLDGLFDFYWGGPERRITGLTLRIIAVNAAALVMLAVGIVYLGQYHNNLIEAKLATFSKEVEL